MSKARPIVCCQRLCYALREGIIEQLGNRSRLVTPSCCGGIVVKMYFCPFCGVEIEFLDFDDDHDDDHDDELECGVPR